MSSSHLTLFFFLNYILKENLYVAPCSTASASRADLVVEQGNEENADTETEKLGLGGLVSCLEKQNSLAQLSMFNI